MTLKEAIASGKPYRRAGSNYWRKSTDDKFVEFSERDVMAEDWQIDAGAPREWDVCVSPGGFHIWTENVLHPSTPTIRVREISREIGKDEVRRYTNGSSGL